MSIPKRFFCKSISNKSTKEITKVISPLKRLSAFTDQQPLRYYLKDWQNLYTEIYEQGSAASNNRI